MHDPGLILLRKVFERMPKSPSLNIRWLLTLAWITTALFSFGPVLAQSWTPSDARLIQFKNYMASSGLPGETVKTIHQAENDLVWMGVEYEGLVCFDGRNFDVYRHDPDNPQSLSSNFVECILDDGLGNLWVGTQNGLNRRSLGALSHYDNVFEKFFAADSSGLPGDDIIHLFKDSKGQILIGTNKGLCLYQSDRHFKTISLQDKELRVQEIFETEKGEYLIGTNRGLMHLNKNLEFLDFWDAGRLRDLHNVSVNSIEVGPNGNIWIGTRSGVYLIDLKEKTYAPLSDYLYEQPRIGTIGVDDILKDKTGRMWLGMISEGLFVLSKADSGFRYTSYSQIREGGFQGDQVRDLLEDKNGLIWIATKNSGFYQYNNQSETFGLMNTNHETSLGLNDNCVLSLAEDSRQNLYFGTMNGGLNFLNRQTGKFSYFQNEWPNENSLFNNRVQAIEIDPMGRVWIGTVQGLSVYDPRYSTFQNQTLFSIRSIVIDDNHTVWMGGRRGLWFARDLKQEFERLLPKGYEDILSDEVYVLTQSSDGNLWIGLANMGLAEFNPLTEELTWYNDPSRGVRMTANHIRALHETPDGTLWVGTKLNGLFRLNRERDRLLHVPDSVISNSVFSILSDSDDNLWLGTNKGIVKYMVSENKVERFGKKHGLQGELFLPSSHLQTQNGTLYLGGNNGVNYFNPSAIQKTKSIPQVQIKSLKSTGDAYKKDEKGQVQFDYGDHINFDFFLSDYSSPKENNFHYKLRGIDKDWIDSKFRDQISYAHLSPGRYTLLIRGFNADGVESKNMTEVPFTILPPWWRSNPAKISYFIAIVLLLYLAFYLVTYRTKKQHELEVLNLEKEQSEKLTQLKLRFFTNISHEIRTPLTLMLPSAEKLSELFGTRPEGKKHTGIITKNILSLMNLIEELIQFRRIEGGQMGYTPQSVSIRDLITEVFDEFKPATVEKNLDYELTLEEPLRHGSVDPSIVRTIVRNLVSNAIKYTEPTGKVMIEVLSVLPTSEIKKATSLPSTFKQDESDTFLCIKVSDTGIGISKSAMEHIFDRFYRSENKLKAVGSGIGLDIVKSLVTLHEGHIEVSSTKGRGSTFTVYLPLGDLSDLESKSIEETAELAADPPELADVHEHTEKNKDDILIVEDDPAIREMLSELFGSEYNVSLASNGKEGLEKAMDFPQPNLIITDVMMPEMDGLDLCTRVKDSFKTSHIPVLLLTARTKIEDEVAGFGVGANAYVKKPFYPKVLMAKVESLLENQKLIKTHFTKEFQLSAQGVQLPDAEKDLLSSCVKVIENNLDNQTFGVEELSREVGISRTYLFRKLKYLIDLGPLELIYSIRLKKAIALMETKQHSISEIAYMTGFSSPNSFSTTFKKYHKMSPSEFARKNT